MQKDNDNLHVAIIMDGNGRWAQNRKKPRSYGHKIGSENVEKISEFAFSHGVKTLTLYAFSCENWARPKAEVDELMRLLKVYLKKFTKKLVKNQIRLGSTGSAYLKNPDKNNGEFIKSGDILIKNDGTAKFGEISVNGSDSKISGNTWSIEKDYANFSNVNVSGSIETAVFKTNSVQAAGGTMIFRPSYKL
jgi:undecaprenyl diphosphate synthase